MENLEQLNKDFDELNGKYESIIEKLDGIQKENIQREHTIHQLENSFQVINNNIKELMSRVDSMLEEKENHNIFNRKRSNFSIMNVIRMPMRKMTVKTMRTIFTMADIAYEKVSFVKEGLEDIITEAQSESKKRKSSIIPNKQS